MPFWEHFHAITSRHLPNADKPALDTIISLWIQTTIYSLLRVCCTYSCDRPTYLYQAQGKFSLKLNTKNKSLKGLWTCYLIILDLNIFFFTSVEKVMHYYMVIQSSSSALSWSPDLLGVYFFINNVEGICYIIQWEFLCIGNAGCALPQGTHSSFSVSAGEAGAGDTEVRQAEFTQNMKVF